MFFRLLLLFALLPLAELYVIIQVGSRIGALNTIAVVVVTAAIGAWLARVEGYRTLLAVRKRLAQGQLPTSELVDGLLIFVAGAMLLTPGFITDAIGFLVLVPRTRQPVKRWLKQLFESFIGKKSVRIEPL